MSYSKVQRSVLFSISFLSLAACTGNLSSLSKGSGDDSGKALATFDANKYAINKLVCDPLNPGGENTTLDGGLQASLYYLQSNQPRYHNVSDMISKGKASNKNLFFSNLSVPTRLFNAGFPLESGGLVKNDEGADLVEYFALRATGTFGLAAGEEEGDYELAMLSDDGTVWRATGDNISNPILVNNDGDHPTRFGCGQIVHMSRDTRIASQIDYYQGPRYHISVVPMWRKVASGTVAGQDSQCGKLGNEMYFDYNQNSKPQKAYNDLLARGWKPLRAENWKLPGGTDYNPCYNDGEIPVISEFSVNVGTEGYMTVNWQTNIPTTSQVLYRHLISGVEDLTVSDNVLRTSHSIQLMALLVGDIYDIKGISISNTLGRAVSNTVRVMAQ